MTELDFIIICSYRDAVKYYDIYVPLGKEIVTDLEKHCYKIGRAVSHGLCPSCYQRDVATMKAKQRHEKFLQKAREYFKI